MMRRMLLQRRCVFQEGFRAGSEVDFDTCLCFAHNYAHWNRMNTVQPGQVLRLITLKYGCTCIAQVWLSKVASHPD